MTPPPASGSAAPLHHQLGLVSAAIALEAGRMAAAEAHLARSTVRTKATPTDLVTAVDTATEALVVDRLQTNRPHDGLAGEEGARRTGTSGVTWHIDPIDGTTNLVYGVGGFAVSIAAEIDGEMVAAAVYDPTGDRLFRAVRDGGAWANDVPISCRTTDRLDTALVATGFAYDAEVRRSQAETLVEVLPRVRDIRRLGSAALDLCLVAAGVFDAYFERSLNLWDFAAGWLIATEAGAVVTDLHDGPPSSDYLVAAAPGVYGPLIELLRDPGRGCHDAGSGSEPAG
ncbi:MAG: inositol monophosphatase family protein [Acidimicrobiales bacterium]